MSTKFYEWLLSLIREDRLVKFYQCPEWRKLRLRALRRDNYECVKCRAEGKYHKAENVHHIKEVKLRPELALDFNNIECICIRHHNEEHDRYQPKEIKEKKKTFTNFDSEERW